MSGDKSLISAGDWSKTATVLIERVSDAVGGIAKPYQIKRVAKAEAEAEKIHALSKIEISEIERRALERMVREEGRKQANIENITAQAAQQLGDDAHPENLEEDWISNFFEKCRNISDVEMQNLWSKLLAGEAAEPGTYSKRTVGFISDLDKSDANLFTKLLTYGWQIGDIVPLIFDADEEIYKKHGISFNALRHLDDIGLITFGSVSSFKRQGLPKNIGVYYYEKLVALELPKDSDNDLRIGKVLLTSVGQELAHICGSKPDDDFFDFVLRRWINENLCPYSALPNIAPHPTPYLPQ